jgi:indole-3-acetate monooxygenase
VTVTTVPTDDLELRAHALELVDSIADVLESCADEAERVGTLPERGWRALHDTGLFRLKAPRELGGMEADPVTQIHVLERISYIDTTAGWTAFVGAGTLAVISGWLPEEGLRDFMVDGRLPRVSAGVAAGGKAVPVEGGYRVTARWPFGSGSAHAEWVGGSVYVETGEASDGGPPTVVGVVVPVAEATLHDNWDVSSLKGTGSQDISVQDAFIPDEHVYDMLGPPVRGGALYRIGVPGLVSNEHGAFALGAARRALDETAALAKTKTRGYVVPRGTAAREKFQWDLGRADVMLDAAREGLIAVNDEAWRAANAGEPVDAAMQTRLRSMSVWATEVSLEVVRTMFRYAGAKSLYTGNVIDRCLRDVTAASQHGMVADVAYEGRGQVLLGLGDVAPIN